MNYKTRIIDKALKEKLEYTGAVAINGPKWCGKMETALQLQKSKIDLSDTEINNNVYIMENQFSKILDGEKPILIDEWQLYPEIWNSVKTYIDNARAFGFLFENLVYRDLSVYVESLGGYIRHYRDRNNLKCDFVAHFENGKYGLIEVKLGSAYLDEAKEHLLELKKIISNNKEMKAPDFLMIITGSNICMETQDGILIVPIDCLKN